MTREMEDFIRDECEVDEWVGNGAQKVAECDYCGRDIFEWDDETAVVDADGREAHRYCSNCIGYRLEFVKDVLEAAGLWHLTGWADETEAAVKAEIERRKKIGNVSPRRVLVIQRGFGKEARA